MNISQTSSPENSFHAKYSARTTKKGRFIIEDYSDCIVKDYNKFILNLKSCDAKQIKRNEENMKRILEILEIQNKQIKLLQEVIGKGDKTCDTIDKLLEDVKNKLIL